MSHKKQTEKTVTKTYSFKVKSCNKEELVRKAFQEYNDYYNSLSEWITDKLTTTTIGQFAEEYIPEEKKNKKKRKNNESKQNYYEVAVSPQWKDKPLYEAFISFPSTHCDNLITTGSATANPENYNGNSISMPKSYFRTAGYATSCISNFKTKMTSLKPNIKRKSVEPISDDALKFEQCIYEMTNNDLSSAEAYDKRITYLEEKEDKNTSLLKRLSILKDFFQEHENEIKEKYHFMAVENLKSFGGCKRTEKRAAMNFLQIQRLKLERKASTQGFLLTLPLKDNNIVFDLWGRRDVIKNDNELVDICNNHAHSLTIKIKNDELYADIVATIPFEKNTPEGNNFKKTTGMDINTKHALIQTSIDNPNSLKDYVNIYEEFAKDIQLNEILGHDSEIMRSIRENAKTANFLPIEYDMLGSRILDLEDNLKLAEDRIIQILKNLAKKYSNETDTQKRIYVQNVTKIRALIKQTLSIDKKYSAQQTIHDTDIQKKYKEEKNLTEETHLPKEILDKLHTQYPFIRTAMGSKLHNERTHLRDKIVALRDNIVIYAYKTLEKNNYDLISLENITSSSFQKKQLNFPTPKSLLKYHKLEGKTKEEIENIPLYTSHQENYIISYNKDNKVSDITYSQKGETLKRKCNMRDSIIKYIHFAEIKDIFIQCSNNGKTHVATVPSFFTSQIDSTDHKLILTSKNTIPDKRKIRPQQEKHINGLNADLNAARNIEFIATDPQWRNIFCKPTKNKYGQPLLQPAVSSQNTMLMQLKKLNATKQLTDL